jgi:hypothetical protein
MARKFTKTGRWIWALLIVPLLLMVVYGCGVGTDDGVGTLVLKVPTTDNEFRVMSVEPSLDMLIASYVVTGQGPEPADTLGPYTIVKPETSAVFQQLAAGVWTVYVSARNSTDIEIGYGSDTIVVQGATVSELSISVAPLSGTGTMHIDIDWTPPELIGIPGLTSTTAPVTSFSTPTDITSEWSINTDNAEVTRTMNTGWHLLTFVLEDDGTAVWGFASAVRIVKDQLSEYLKTLTASDLNSIVGEIDLEIFEEMQNALHLIFTGAQPQVTTGSDMVIDLTIDEASPPALSYIGWFVNGVERVADRDSTQLTIGSDLADGLYRLDCVVGSTDTLRAGSKSYLFEVGAFLEGTVDVWRIGKIPDTSPSQIEFGYTITNTGTISTIGQTEFDVVGVYSGVNYVTHVIEPTDIPVGDSVSGVAVVVVTAGSYESCFARNIVFSP